MRTRPRLAPTLQQSEINAAVWFIARVWWSQSRGAGSNLFILLEDLTIFSRLNQASTRLQWAESMLLAYDWPAVQQCLMTGSKPATAQARHANDTAVQLCEIIRTRSVSGSENFSSLQDAALAAADAWLHDCLAREIAAACLDLQCLGEASQLASTAQRVRGKASGQLLDVLGSVPNPLASVRDADLVQLGVLGGGSYGSCHVALHPPSDSLFAVKSMSKHLLAHKNAVHFTAREIVAAACLQSPFLAAADFAVETDTHIKLGMQRAAGGDLERHLMAQPDYDLSEEAVRFYAAELLIALKHLHQAGIVHRDVKSNNVLLDASGHIKLTDFGLCVLLHSCSQKAPQACQPCKGDEIPEGLAAEGIATCCVGCLQVNRFSELQKAGVSEVHRRAREAAQRLGKPAPEPGCATVSCRDIASLDCSCAQDFECGQRWYKGQAGTAAYWCRAMLTEGPGGERNAYGVDADWWSYACTVYSLMAGRSPFQSGHGREEDNQRTINAKVKFADGLFSNELQDLLSRMLDPDDSTRLGCGSCAWASVAAHPWFAGIDWDLVEARVMPPPMAPGARVGITWDKVRDKMKGYDASAVMDRRAEREAKATSEQVLTQEQCSLFASMQHLNPRLAPKMAIHALCQAMFAEPGPAEDAEACEGLPDQARASAAVRRELVQPDTFSTSSLQSVLNMARRGGAAFCYSTAAVLPIVEPQFGYILRKSMLLEHTSSSHGSTGQAIKLLHGYHMKPKQSATRASVASSVSMGHSGSSVSSTDFDLAGLELDKQVTVVETRAVRANPATCTARVPPAHTKSHTARSTARSCRRSPRLLHPRATASPKQARRPDPANDTPGPVKRWKAGRGQATPVAVQHHSKARRPTAALTTTTTKPLPAMTIDDSAGVLPYAPNAGDMSPLSQPRPSLAVGATRWVRVASFGCDEVDLLSPTAAGRLSADLFSPPPVRALSTAAQLQASDSALVSSAAAATLSLSGRHHAGSASKQQGWSTRSGSVAPPTASSAARASASGAVLSTGVQDWEQRVAGRHTRASTSAHRAAVFMRGVQERLCKSRRAASPREGRAAKPSQTPGRPPRASRTRRNIC